MNNVDYTHLWEKNTDRAELARLFKGMGRGLNCRLDIPIVTLEDVKWASVVFDELRKELTRIAFDGDRPDVYRVMSARFAMETAKAKLQHKNDRKSTLKISRKLRERNY